VDDDPCRELKARQAAERSRLWLRKDRVGPAVGPFSLWWTEQAAAPNLPAAPPLQPADDPSSYDRPLVNPDAGNRRGRERSAGAATVHAVVPQPQAQWQTLCEGRPADPLDGDFDPADPASCAACRRLHGPNSKT